MKRTRTVFFVCLLLTEISFLDAQTFSQFTNNLKIKALEIILYENDTKISKNNIDKAKSINDIKVKLAGDFFHIKNNQLGTMSFFQLDTSGINTSVRVEKFFSYTGTSFFLDTFLNNTTYKKNENIIYNNVYEPTISLRVQQPLLYNSFGSINKYVIQKAKTTHQISRIKEKINTRILLNYYSKLYFERLTYKNIIEFFKQNLKNTQSLYVQTKEKAQKGLLDYDDVEKALSATLQLKIKLIDAEGYLQSIEDEIKKQVSISNSNITELNLFFEKSTNFYYENIPFEETQNGKMLLLIKTDAQENQNIAKNKKQPELNFFANVEYKNSFGNSILNSYPEIADPGFMIGLELKDPFGNSFKKTELEEAKLELREKDLEYRLAEDAYNLKIKKILASINLYKKSYNIKVKNMISLIKREKIEKAKYETGRLGLSFLIITENEIINAKIDMASLKSKLIQLYLDYFLIIF